MNDSLTSVQFNNNNYYKFLMTTTDKYSNSDNLLRSTSI